MADNVGLKENENDKVVEGDMLKTMRKILTCYLGVNPNMDHNSRDQIDTLSYRLLYAVKGVADRRGYNLSANGLAKRGECDKEAEACLEPA